MKRLSVISVVLFLIFLPVTVANADSVNYSDTTPPVIESISLNPSVVNVTAKGAVLIATIVASDDLNKMTSFSGYLSPLYGANPQTSSNEALSTKIVNGRVQVTFQLKYVFEKGTPTGDYQIRATVYDAADNRLVASGANMPGNSFKVINDAATSSIDVTEFDYSAKLQAYVVQTQSLNSELATSKKRITELEKQLSALNSSGKTKNDSNNSTVTSESSQIQALKTYLLSIENKLKIICSKKPKPKGC
jgi:hypothetical protein